MDWQMVAALAASCAVAGAFIDRVFGRRDLAVKELARAFQAHELSDAASFAELRASVAALARDQVGIEARISARLDSIERAINANTIRMDKIIEGRA